MRNSTKDRFFVASCTATVLATVFLGNAPAQKGSPAVPVDSLISLKTLSDASRKRSELIRLLWGKSGLPKRLPANVNKKFQDSRYKDLYNKSLKSIEHVTVKMDYRLESHIYHFLPKKPNGKLVLFHQGHRGDFYNSKDAIGRLLNNGYSVAGFCMPLLGLNNKPTVLLPRFGVKKRIAAHEDIRYLTPKQGHPLRYFLEPIPVFLNYAAKEHSYKAVAMMGISGGGWTTTLAAAVDTRIKYSIPVAGTYPMYLRFANKRDLGDYEQYTPEVYNTCNYLEMYVLAAVGDGRKQLQVINEFDSCCFAGTGWRTYHSAVQNRVKQLGGDWDLFMDSSHKGHMISATAMRRILVFLNEL